MSLFLDFRKVFDLVDHSILIEKLSLYKRKNNTLDLFLSYLHARKRVIENGQGTSKPALINSGVPHGSILRPTLFLIFINNLPLHMNHCFIFFRRRCYLSYQWKSESEVEPKLQQDGDNSKTWAKQHKMKNHYDKTSCMVVGTRHKTREASGLNIHIENHKLKQVDKQKLLGVFIDENLSWTAY